MENEGFIMRVPGSIYNGEVPGSCDTEETKLNLVDFDQKVQEVIEQGNRPSSKNTGLKTCNGEWEVVQKGDEYTLKRPTYLCGECDSNMKMAVSIVSFRLRLRNLQLRLKNRPLEEEPQEEKPPSEVLCCAVDGSHLRPRAVAPALATTTTSVTPENALSMLCMVMEPRTTGNQSQPPAVQCEEVLKTPDES